MRFFPLFALAILFLCAGHCVSAQNPQDLENIQTTMNRFFGIWTLQNCTTWAETFSELGIFYHPKHPKGFVKYLFFFSFFLFFFSFFFFSVVAFSLSHFFSFDFS